MPKGEPLAPRAQGVQRRRTGLPRARSIGQLVLGGRARLEERVQPRLELAPRGPLRRPPLLRGGLPAVDRGEVENGDRRLKPHDLMSELLGPLGRGGLERERTQPFPHLLLQVARALDLRRDPRQLQLGAMPPELEAPQPGRLLDERAALGRLRREDRLDAPLRDHRAQAAAEADIREQLDQVDPANARAVDEVPALAAAMESPCERHLRERQVGPGAVGVVEHELDLAMIDGAPPGRPCEEDVVGLLGAKLVGAQRARRPEDGVRDVRLAGAVRPHHDRDARLEVHLDLIHERLEAAQFDRLEMHARQVCTWLRTWSPPLPAGYTGGVPPSIAARPSSASRAASCSASFLDPPLPTPAWTPPMTAAAVKVRSCAGPCESRSV